MGFNYWLNQYLCCQCISCYEVRFSPLTWVATNILSSAQSIRKVEQLDNKKANQSVCSKLKDSIRADHFDDNGNGNALFTTSFH